MTKQEIQDRMEACPWRERPIGNPYVCTRYWDTTVLCDGACSWVVEYPKLKELKAQKGELKVMKTNEAPEKIYLQVCGDCNQTDCEGCKFEDLEDNVTWCKDKIFKKDIEYTRTDAFIEKVEKYLTEKFIKDVSILAGGVVNINFAPAISNFLKYMKEE